MKTNPIFSDWLYINNVNVHICNLIKGYKT